MEKKIKFLNIKKTTTLKLLHSVNKCPETLTKLFNDTTNNSKFPDELKLAEAADTVKKDDPTNSKNYRPLSILPIVSMVFERIIHR